MEDFDDLIDSLSEEFFISTSLTFLCLAFDFFFGLIKDLPFEKLILNICPSK